jgi:uncharacterized protein
MRLTFEWDKEKAKNNIKKHKISFEEAKTIFYDPFIMIFHDPDHSNFEHRYITLAISSKGRVLVVVYTERNSNIRIISCRKATRNERRIYEKRSF